MSIKINIKLKSKKDKRKERHCRSFFVSYLSLQSQPLPQFFVFALFFVGLFAWFDDLFVVLLVALLFLFCSILTPLLNRARVVFACAQTFIRK